MAAGATLAGAKKDVVVLKSFSAPPARAEAVCTHLQAFVSDTKVSTVTWAKVKGGVFAKPINFSSINFDALTANQKSIVAAGAKMDDLRPVSLAAEYIREFFIAIKAYLDA